MRWDSQLVYAGKKEGVLPCMAKSADEPVDGMITEINERNWKECGKKGIAIKLGFSG